MFHLDCDILDYDPVARHGTLQWTAMTGMSPSEVIRLFMTLHPDVASFDIHIHDRFTNDGLSVGTRVSYHRQADDQWTSMEVRHRP